ncbi:MULTISPECIES: metallophosphoesterase [Bacillaceae]|uniref:metallophosphoesterase n=2 Tax=Bacillales TaxID=1385 RepID=UPI001E4DCC93|nr:MULTISPECIES: metallophosphoesterase [Bacillaceae]MCE4049647.1 metallophosphoesterase [Bacillus sp. Au-Bac7]UPO87417.1 metallophosphoesterase [Niallia sp. Man26]
MMKKRNLLLAAGLIICAALFSYYQNNKLDWSSYTITSQKLAGAGVKIVQLSDLHSKQFGENQTRLVTKVKAVKPDIITFTGDLVDQKKYNEKAALALMKQLAAIAPTFYVTGNHEYWSGRYEQLEEGLKAANINILHNRKEKLHMNGTTLLIAGVDDPAVSGNDDAALTVEGELKVALEGVTEQDFVLLLSHRPELFSLYEKHDIDLVLSGHAHGGQVRIPFVGGLVAPDQGFMPKYTAGMFEKNETAMIVNRGLGNSIIPQRVFNTPEIVEITIKNK